MSSASLHTDIQDSRKALTGLEEPGMEYNKKTSMSKPLFVQQQTKMLPFAILQKRTQLIHET